MTLRQSSDRWAPRRGLIGAALLCASLPWLASCEQSREALGLTKNQPDEFAVVTRAPLIVPPELTLRPPSPGAPRPQEYRPSEQAQAALFDEPVANAPAANDELPAAETALLQAAGADRADPNIRQVLRQESALFASRDEGFVDRLVFWREDSPPGELVDAAKERERLQENAATGRSVTEGETPVVIERDKALFEEVF